MIEKIRHYFLQRKDSRLFIFRLLAVMLVADFLAFHFLSGRSLFSLLNPVKFVTDSAADPRRQLALFYPEAILYQADNVAPRALLEVKQKVRQYDASEQPDRQKRILQNASLILQQLALGSDNPRTASLFKSKYIVKKMWLMNDELVIHTASEKWNELSDQEQALARQCIEKSLLAALPELKAVRWGH